MTSSLLSSNIRPDGHIGGGPRALRLAHLLVIAAAAGACREDVTSPGGSEPVGPGLAVEAAAAPVAFRQISAGLGQTCGVATNDQAYCWGDGRLLVPKAIGVGLHFRQISAGNSHVCGVTLNDRVFCWGSNSFGQLGNGRVPSDIDEPVLVSGGLSFRLVRAGGVHTCAVTTDDRAYCWGAGFSGQLGTGGTGEQDTPVAVAGGLRFRQVFAGFVYTCGVTTGNLAYCWGDNREGQLGNGTSGRLHGSLLPVAVAGGHSFRLLVTSPTGTTGVGEHTCGVTTDDRAYCWGGNGYGQLGDGTTTRRTRPVAVAGGRAFSAVHAGYRHTCGTTTDGRAFCWGANHEGELGNGTTFNRSTPGAVSGGLHFTGVSAGGFHTCGVATDTRAYCWGSNTSEQIGDGLSELQRLKPTAVAAPSGG